MSHSAGACGRVEDVTKIPVLDIKISIEENTEMNHKREESIKLLLQGKTPQEIIELICIGEK